MADGHFPTLISKDRNSNAANNPLYIQLSDGSAVITTLDVNITNASIPVTDNGGSLTVDAVNLDIRDLTSVSDSVSVLQSTHDNLNANVTLQIADVDVSNSNPVPIRLVETAITGEVHDYDTASAVASDASSTHTYTATGTFLLKQVVVSSSGGSKFEIQVDGSTIAVGFIPKEGGSKSIELAIPAEAGTDVDVIRTNRQGAAQDLYSTIIGREV